MLRGDAKGVPLYIDQIPIGRISTYFCTEHKILYEKSNPDITKSLFVGNVVPW